MATTDKRNSIFADGKYTLISPQGVKTPCTVKKGIVFVDNGFCGGRTGKTLEHFCELGYQAPKAQPELEERNE